MGAAITGSALPFLLQMSLALPITALQETRGNEVFSSQARLARIFICSAGQESASACCSVRAALQPCTALGWDTVAGLWQGHGAGLWQGHSAGL